ncbi:MAG: hypothetical protein ACR2HV_06415, partial [Acidimicrobiales bacterium]
AYDEAGNYIGEYQAGEFTPETEAQAAWADFDPGAGSAEGGAPEGGASEGTASEGTASEGAAELVPGAVGVTEAAAEAPAEVETAQQGSDDQGSAGGDVGIPESLAADPQDGSAGG